MTVKVLNNKFLFKRFTVPGAGSYVGAVNEPVLDFSSGTPKLAIHDGSTPGGHTLAQQNIAGVETPSIVTPANGESNIAHAPIITASSFNGIKSDGTADTHTASRWQISTVSDFTSIVFDSGNDTDSLTSIDLGMVGVILDPETVYYVRVKYIGASNSSSYSPTISFTTAAAVVQGTQVAKLLASDGFSNFNFGYAVDISNDGKTAIVGSPLAEDDRGAVYVYVNSNGIWTQQAKLVTNDRTNGDRFGYSVSISSDGNIAVIGAYLDDDNGTDSGSAYVFTRAGSTWTQQAKLLASNGAANDQFGHSVSISDDGGTIAIGAPYKDNNGADAGFVYVFSGSGSTWTQQAIVTSASNVAGDRFGKSISISADGNTLLVGSIGNDINGTDSGVAYIFTRSGSTWTEQASLNPATSSAGDVVGYSVSISGDGNTAILGAINTLTGGIFTGAAYVFTRSGSTWAEQAKLVASDVVSGAQFGTSVSLSEDGNEALISEWTANSNAGAAYIFTRSGTTWTQQAKLVANDGAQGDRFGSSVALSGLGESAIVGAYQDDDNGTDSGSAYIFE